MGVSRAITAAFLVGFLLLAMIPVDNNENLEENSIISYRTNSNDGYSAIEYTDEHTTVCLLYTSPSPRDATLSRMPSSA